MRLKSYLSHLLTLLDDSPYLESRQVTFDERPPDAGLIRVTLTFLDGSRLHLKEFIIFGRREHKIVKYGYQYLAADETILFRYDNALDPAARHLSTWPEHKHTGNTIIAAQRISHEELLQEINELISLGL